MQAIEIGIDELKELNVNYETPKMCEIPFDLSFNSSLELYKIYNEFKSDVYIVSTPEAEAVASRPEIVGEKMKYLMLETARKVLPLIHEKHLKEDSLFILLILRAAVGYEAHVVFKELLDSVSIGYIRPKYVTPSFGDHVDKKLEIKAHNLDKTLPESENLALFIPDTYASGLTAVESLKTVFKVAEEKGTEISKVIIYGFIADKSIEALENLLNPRGVDLIVYALCDIPQLASNGYDMVLGPDPHTLEKEGKVKYLNSTVPLPVAIRMLNKHGYVPGVDQPGDFSERQKRLINLKLNNGNFELVLEQGNIKDHLQHSLKRLELLEERFLPKLDGRLGIIVGKNISKRKRALLNVMSHYY